MVAEGFPVDRDVRRIGCALEFQPGFLAGIQRRLGELLGVTAGAPVVIVAAVLAVYCVPGVGQGDGFVLSLLGKKPALIE